MRGNQRERNADRDRQGSIPACAGEPARGRTGSEVSAVYPRVCGGTGCIMRMTADEWGLSPRVRGNRCLGICARVGVGSIPACAGEPPWVELSRGPGRVYPRVCGGTGRSVNHFSLAQGLSPRVRGNLRAMADTSNEYGSIPACAGEPRAPTPPTGKGRVYPRVCGGTQRATLSPTPRCGLSPRVRGNLPESDVWSRLGRSIPACAGEPRGFRFG